MPIDLISGPANAGKAQLVFDALRARLARGEEPLLVVPTRADAEHYLRELAADGAVMGLRVERFRGLSEEIVARAGIDGAPLSELAQERLLARLAVRSGLAEEGAAADGTLRALRELVAELELRAVTPQRLRQALTQWADAEGAGSGALALAELYHGYHRELARMQRRDPRQRLLAALDALRAAPALWRGTSVLLYGFDSFDDLQLDVVETLGSVVGASVTVSLTYEPGRCAFAGRARTFAALEPIAAERREAPAREDYYEPRSRAALAHLERSLFELDAAPVEPGAAVALLEGGGERAELELIAREIRALLDDGMPAGEIAVAARHPESVADLLEEVFLAGSIPFALERRRRLEESAVGRALTGLMRCVAPAEGAGSDGELADLLAWLRAPGLLERPALADSLELAARRTGLVSADAARALWESRHWPLERIDRMLAAQQSGQRALLDRAERELALLFNAPRRGAAAVLAGNHVDDARALVAARRALAELRDLLELAPELVPRDAAALADVLARVEFISGQPPSPDAVAVLDPLALRARRVRALFLCALQEGSFPARAPTRALLSEDERRRIAALTGLVLGAPEDALDAERYLLYAAVSRPEQLLVLSWHTADDDGAVTPRSLFVDDVCDLFDCSLLEGRARRALGEIDPVQAAGALEPGDREQLSSEPLLEQVRARPWSASSLETWMRCPMRWFIERVIAPGTLDPDAEPLTRGALAHEALRDTLARLRERTGSARLEPGNLELARELLAEALERAEPQHRLSLAPERVPGARRRLRAELERYLGHAAAAASPLEPAELELAFGFAEEGSLPAYELEDGVVVRGRIDRVDVSGAGEAVVYDYKARRAPPSARWIADRSIQVALYMLAVEALLGLPVAGGFYQPLSGSDLRARGVLDAGSGIELECVRGELREHDELRALLDDVRQLARAAAAESRSGRLHGEPDSCAFEGGCMFPSICRPGR